MILEEVVGDFTSAVPGLDDDISEEQDGSFLVRGNTYLRDINRQLAWDLPTKASKTVNGLITEQLEDIPVAATCFKLSSYTIEIVQTRGASVHVARLKRLN